MKLLIALMLITAIGFSYTNSIQQKVVESFSNRKTIDTLVKQIGIVKQAGTAENPYYLISYDAGYLYLYVANLPVIYRKENTTITFSGAMKEMHPMEDEHGQFFVLSSIELKY